jgi:hypothetical protein
MAVPRTRRPRLRPVRQRGGAALSPELRRLVDAAHRERERDVRKIVLECRRRYAEYRALTGPLLVGLRQNVRLLVAGFYQYNLIEGRTPTLEELDVTIANARARVAQGVSLQGMIGTFQLALPILWERLIDTVGPHSEVLLELLRRVPVTFASINHVTTIVTQTYLTEREQLLRSRGEAIADFLRLVGNAEAPVGTIDARARELAVDLEVPRVAVQLRRARALDGRRGTDLGARLLERCVAERDAVAARSDDGILALLPHDASERVLDELASQLVTAGWRAGVGSVAADAAELRRSVLEARRALELGAFRRGGAPIARYADLALHDLVDVGSARAQLFAQQTLGPLARAATRGIYRDTLRALSAQGFRLKPAAAALKIHPHTLSYRLKQMQRRYGLDLGDAQTRLKIALALLILGG